jgi:hypothetical protein
VRRILIAAVALLVLVACGSGETPPSGTDQPSATPIVESQAPIPSEAAPRNYALECGPMQAQACDVLAEGLAVGAEKNHPGRTVVSIQITGADGDYELLFDDGTAIGADIN